MSDTLTPSELDRDDFWNTVTTRLRYERINRAIGVFHRITEQGDHQFCPIGIALDELVARGIGRWCPDPEPEEETECTFIMYIEPGDCSEGAYGTVLEATRERIGLGRSAMIWIAQANDHSQMPFDFIADSIDTMRRHGLLDKDYDSDYIAFLRDLEQARSADSTPILLIDESSSEDASVFGADN